MRNPAPSVSLDNKVAMEIDERRRRYEMLGVVSYAEQKIVDFKVKHGKNPSMVLLGQLEWEVILLCEPDTEFTIAGVPAVPNSLAGSCVEVKP